MQLKSGMKVRADIKKNILCITIAGNIRKKYVDSVYTDVRFCVADLKPGFTVITDLSKCSIGHLSGLSTFKRIMNYLQDNEVKKVIRVVGKKSVLFKQLTKVSSTNANYDILYCTTLEEALQLLEESTEAQTS